MSKHIYEVYQSLGFDTVEKGPFKAFVGTFATGGMDECVGDYDVGLLGVDITMGPCGKGVFSPRIHIYTIDDGGWYATSTETGTADEMQEIVNKIHTAWEWEYKLPKEEELNKFLMQFKMWGQVG